MYMPGRLRTASRPSRTVMSWAPYEPLLFEPFFFAGCSAKLFLPPRKAPTPEPLSAGSGRYIRPPWILAGYPPNRTARRATKCPQIALKQRPSATVRGRTDHEPQLLHGGPSEGGGEAGHQVGAEQLQFLRPDAGFTRDRNHPVTLRDGRGGVGEPRPGDPVPGGLDLGEQRLGRDVRKGGVEGVREPARSEALHAS